MNHPFVRAALSLETGWTWLYTAGMAPEVAERRREEIAAHNHEFHEWLHLAAVEDRRAAMLHVIAQFVFGIPADIGWRAQCGRAAFSMRAIAEGFIAGAIFAGSLLLLPAAVAVAMQYRLDTEAGMHLSLATATVLVGALLLLVAPGLIAMEKWPNAGTSLVAVGIACIAIVLWWFVEAVLVCVAGLVATVIGAQRIRRSS